MDTKKTGELIRKKRLELNLTQQELADRLFITPSTISKYENGRGFPDTSLLEPLSDALGLSINEILKGEELQERPADNDNFREIIKLASEEKKSFKKRYIAVSIILSAALLIGTIGGFLINSWKKDIVILNYDDCVGKYISDSENPAIQNYVSFIGDCICFSIMSPSEGLICQPVKNQDNSISVMVFATASKWSLMTKEPEPHLEYITNSKEESSQIRYIYFFNGHPDYESVISVLHNGRDKSELIASSVIIYDRGY